jgi:hypothetical protein
MISLRHGRNQPRISARTDRHFDRRPVTALNTTARVAPLKPRRSGDRFRQYRRGMELSPMNEEITEKRERIEHMWLP